MKHSWVSYSNKMPQRQYPTTPQKWQCIGMLQAGESQNHVARSFWKSKSVIANWWRQNDVIGRLQPSKIARTEAGTPCYNWTLNFNRTVRRKLREAGLKARRPFRGVIMSRVTIRTRLRNSYTMGCPPLHGDNPRALASGLYYVQVDKHGITILYHQHECRPCTSRDISC